jgi:hypothetical protein
MRIFELELCAARSDIFSNNRRIFSIFFINAMRSSDTSEASLHASLLVDTVIPIASYAARENIPQVFADF